MKAMEKNLWHEVPHRIFTKSESLLFVSNTSTICGTGRMIKGWECYHMSGRSQVNDP